MGNTPFPTDRAREALRIACGLPAKPEGKINMSENETQADSAEKPQHIYPVANLLKFFECGHLPPKLQAVSGSFCSLAHELAVDLPHNAEKTTALRKLLEAKDCAVRAVL